MSGIENSRLVVVGRVQRLGVGGRVAVEDVAVLDGVRLPRPLVFGEVPARGELGLQRLRTARQSDSVDYGLYFPSSVKDALYSRPSWFILACV